MSLPFDPNDLSNNTMASMPFVRPSIESGLGPSNVQDPYDWTVDQVVHALCSSDSSSLATKALVPLADSNAFASLLKEHLIDGEALLTGLNPDILSEKLGVKAHGLHVKILNFIERLQQLSSKYRDKLERQISSPSRLFSVAQMSQYSTPYWRSPVQPEVHHCILPLGPSYEAAPASSSLEPGLLLQQTMPGAAGVHQVTDVSGESYLEPVREDGSPLLISTSNGQQETTLIDEKGRKRRRLVLGPSSGAETLVPFRQALVSPEGNLPQHNDQAGHDFKNDTAPGTDDGPRLPPSSDHFHLSTQPKSNGTSSQPISNHRTDEDAQSSQPRCKRIQPTLISDPAESSFDIEGPLQTNNPPEFDPVTEVLKSTSFLKQSAPGKKAKRDADQIYLGTSAFPVDDIFYRDIDFGKPLHDDAEDPIDEFSIESKREYGSAQRLYVNARLKYFLRRPRLSFTKNGDQKVGLVTYPDRLGKKNRPLSMTLFSSTSDGILATRANRARWVLPVSEAKADTIGDKESSDVFKVTDPGLALDEDDGSWDALEKWKYMINDETLPRYGDSGSEGEYDLDTWREMEAESGTIARPNGSSRSRKLSKEEVDKALKTAVQIMRDEWQLKQRLKLQHKAWRLWARARRDGTKQLQEESLIQRRKELQERVQSLLKEIQGEEWTKLTEVMRQARIMQPSVFDQEECQWKLAVIQSKQAPQKLPSVARKPQTRPATLPTEALKDGEEILDSDISTVEDSESDDGLEGFIVDDEMDGNDSQLINGDDDTVMADVEDAVDSDTLIVRSSSIVTEKTEERHLPRTPQKVKKHSAPSPKMFSSVIDLTQASDPISSPQKAESSRIVTPPLHSEEDSDAWFQRSRGKKAVFRPPPKARTIITVINLDTDSSDSQAVINRKLAPQMPPFDDLDGIRALSPTELVERQDRKRLLVWLIAHTLDDKRERTSIYVDGMSMEDCFDQVTVGLQTLKAKKGLLPAMDKETSESILQVAAWYVGWTIPIKLDRNGINLKHIDITLDNGDGFELFWEFMLECLDCYAQQDSFKRSQATVASPKKKAKRANKSVTKGLQSASELSDSAPDQQIFATESQETIQKRDAALQRMRENDQRARQKVLKARLSGMSTLQKDPSDVIVNPGKLDEQDYIHLSPKFGYGAQLKAHQKEGLQFMWREITGDHDDLQGCLLAQTMGLGKTMQVIALLVAISDAARSSNDNIRDQVPVEIRESRTLVLVPPALIENWSDEFLLWPPASHQLGTLRKVGAALKLNERLHEIRGWSRDGGILLMGYSTFKDLIHNKPRQGLKAKAIESIGIAPLNEEDHRVIKTALLEGPNIVVADEAHEFKNQNSNINQAINQIKCKSRVALTGSPLSNSLGEYFSMIDWIAPGYLGSYGEFKATYEDPIKTGLYQDSKPWQYRDSRKRLKALELELEPKVHRADITALHGQLSGKSEFVVRVPLTLFQKDIYCRFVESMSGMTAEDGPKVRTAQLWSWLSALQLLCNHPKLFHDKLLEGLKAPKSNARRKAPVGNTEDHNLGPSLSASDEELIIDDPLAKTALSQSLTATQAAFREVDDTGALCLSNKMQALMSILELSEAAHDKVLVFSHRLGTLDYVEEQLSKLQKTYARIDGDDLPQKRQQITKAFNDGDISVCLISTRAGGQGLNLFGANRVVILDGSFNPMWEQQAVGRAYRIGQKKHVFVYRLTVAGTFEEEIQSQALFKEQLATRVVDKKNPERHGVSGAKLYLFMPREVEKSDLKEFEGKDVMVLDHLLVDQEKTPIVSITPSETFYIDDGQDLTPQERREAEQMLRDEKLRRRNYPLYLSTMQKRRDERNRSIMNGTTSLSQLNPVPPDAPWNSSINMIATPFAPTILPSPHNIAPPSSPGCDLDHIPPMPAQVMADIEQRIEYTIASIFPSKAPSARERASKAVRMEAKTSIHSLVSSKCPLDSSEGIPHPTDISRKLRVMIEENAKDEADYRHLWQGVKQLLEMDDVHPNALLKVMVDKLRDRSTPWPFNRSNRANSISSGNSSANKQRMSSTPTPVLISLDRRLKGLPETAPTSDPASLDDRHKTMLGRARSAKRSPSRGSAESGRPSKKQKPTSMDTSSFNGMGAKGDQSKRLLESEK